MLQNDIIVFMKKEPKSHKEYWIWKKLTLIIIGIPTFWICYVLLFSPFLIKLEYEPIVNQLPHYANVQSLETRYNTARFVDNFEGGIVTFTTQDNSETVLNFYTDKLLKQGWKKSDFTNSYPDNHIDPPNIVTVTDTSFLEQIQGRTFKIQLNIQEEKGHSTIVKMIVDDNRLVH